MNRIEATKRRLLSNSEDKPRANITLTTNRTFATVERSEDEIKKRKYKIQTERYEEDNIKNVKTILKTKHHEKEKINKNKKLSDLNSVSEELKVLQNSVESHNECHWKLQKANKRLSKLEMALDHNIQFLKQKKENILKEMESSEKETKSGEARTNFQKTPNLDLEVNEKYKKHCVDLGAFGDVKNQKKTSALIDDLVKTPLNNVNFPQVFDVCHGCFNPYCPYSACSSYGCVRGSQMYARPNVNSGCMQNEYCNCCHCQARKIKISETVRRHSTDLKTEYFYHRKTESRATSKSSKSSSPDGRRMNEIQKQLVAENKESTNKQSNRNSRKDRHDNLKKKKSYENRIKPEVYTPKVDSKVVEQNRYHTTSRMKNLPSTSTTPISDSRTYTVDSNVVEQNRNHTTSRMKNLPSTSTTPISDSRTYTLNGQEQAYETVDLCRDNSTSTPMNSTYRKCSMDKSVGNTNKSDSTYDETQYSVETLKMLRRMRVKEYIAEKRNKERQNNSDAIPQHKSKVYDEYIEAYKYQYPSTHKETIQAASLFGLDDYEKLYGATEEKTTHLSPAKNERIMYQNVRCQTSPRARTDQEDSSVYTQTEAIRRSIKNQNTSTMEQQRKSYNAKTQTDKQRRKQSSQDKFGVGSKQQVIPGSNKSESPNFSRHRYLDSSSHTNENGTTDYGEQTPQIRACEKFSHSHISSPQLKYEIKMFREWQKLHNMQPNCEAKKYSDLRRGSSESKYTWEEIEQIINYQLRDSRESQNLSTRKWESAEGKTIAKDSFGKFISLENMVLNTDELPSVSHYDEKKKTKRDTTAYNKSKDITADNKLDTTRQLTDQQEVLEENNISLPNLLTPILDVAIPQKSALNTLEYLKDLLYLYHNGQLEDEHLKTLTEELLRNLKIDCFCSQKNLTSSMDKSSYAQPEQKTQEIQCSNSKDIEDANKSDFTIHAIPNNSAKGLQEKLSEDINIQESVPCSTKNVGVLTNFTAQVPDTLGDDIVLYKPSLQESSAFLDLNKKWDMKDITNLIEYQTVETTSIVEIVTEEDVISNLEVPIYSLNETENYSNFDTNMLQETLTANQKEIITELHQMVEEEISQYSFTQFTTLDQSKNINLEPTQPTHNNVQTNSAVPNCTEGPREYIFKDSRDESDYNLLKKKLTKCDITASKATSFKYEYEFLETNAPIKGILKTDRARLSFAVNDSDKEDICPTYSHIEIDPVYNADSSKPSMNHPVVQESIPEMNNINPENIVYTQTEAVRRSVEDQNTDTMKQQRKSYNAKGQTENHKREKSFQGKVGESSNHQVTPVHNSDTSMPSVNHPVVQESTSDTKNKNPENTVYTQTEAVRCSVEDQNTATMEQKKIIDNAKIQRDKLRREQSFPVNIDDTNIELPQEDKVNLPNSENPCNCHMLHPDDFVYPPVNCSRRKYPTFQQCPCMLRSFVNVMKIYNKRSRSPLRCRNVKKF